MSQEGFWDNSDSSTKVVKQLKGLKSSVEPWETAAKKLQELKELTEILQSQDAGLISEVELSIDSLSRGLEELEFKTLLDSPFDASGAILSINAGAGGTESCDWVSMIFRMYTRFAEKHGYTVTTTDANGCTVVSPVTLNQPTAITFNAPVIINETEVPDICPARQL